MTTERPKTPLLAVDLIILHPANPGRIAIIQRRHAPEGWALPGGFVDVGETVEQAAVREGREETSLDLKLEALLGVYSDPARDPRGHTVSVVYVARGDGEARAQDDAQALDWLDPEDRAFSLVFDHQRILGDYLRYRATGEIAPIRHSAR
jgi:8-oxo-dGTP diphosphatase